jgi:hypothetical protein
MSDARSHGLPTARSYGVGFGLDLTHTPRENLLTLCFAALLIVIMIGGSLWIMFDLHHRMI